MTGHALTRADFDPFVDREMQVTIGARADLPEESAGLDLSQHGEEAYFGTDLGGLAGTGASLGGSVVVETFAVEPPPTAAPEPAV